MNDDYDDYLGDENVNGSDDYYLDNGSDILSGEKYDFDGGSSSFQPNKQTLRSTDPLSIICIVTGIASILFFCLPWIGVSLAILTIILATISIFRFNSQNLNVSSKVMAIIGITLGLLGGLISGILWIIGSIIWNLIR